MESFRILRISMIEKWDEFEKKFPFQEEFQKLTILNPFNDENFIHHLINSNYNEHERNMSDER